jgi:hypothetical protein
MSNCINNFRNWHSILKCFIWGMLDPALSFFIYQLSKGAILVSATSLPPAFLICSLTSLITERITIHVLTSYSWVWCEYSSVSIGMHFTYVYIGRKDVQIYNIYTVSQQSQLGLPQDCLKQTLAKINLVIDNFSILEHVLQRKMYTHV